MHRLTSRTSAPRGQGTYSVLVSEEHESGQRLVEALRSSGHHLLWCGRDAIPSISYLDAEVIVLDLGEPPSARVTLLDHLRGLSPAPVLMLISNTDELSLAGVNPGDAGQYLLKPVDPRELVTRIRQVIDRATLSTQRVVTAREVTIDLERQAVWVRSHQIALAPKEFAILALLARHAGQAVSRHDIENVVWGNVSEGVARRLEVSVATLRAKINCPALIQTVRGFGYRFGEPQGDPRAKVDDGRRELAPSTTELGGRPLRSSHPRPV